MHVTPTPRAAAAASPRLDASDARLVATSQESVLSVEYLPAVGPFTPQVRAAVAARVRRTSHDVWTPTCLQAESPHPDWVSAISGAVPGFVVSGAYDGVTRLWSVAQGRAVGELAGHTAGAASAALCLFPAPRAMYS